MIRALLRLLLVMVLLGAVAWLQRFRPGSGQSALFTAGALLLSGLFAGKVAHGLRLPRLTGYLLIGVLEGPYLLRFVSTEGVSGLDLIKGLGVSLIAFAAGTELEWAFIRRMGGSVLKVAAGTCGLVFLVVGGLLFAASPWLSFITDATLAQRLAMSALVGTVVISFSPTVTIAIVQETRARGTFTDFLMAVVILGDLVVMVAFAFAVAVMRGTLGGAVDWSEIGRDVGWELLGSIAAGAGLGGATAWYLRRVKTHAGLFIAAISVVAAEAGVRLHLSPLLLSLTAGAVIANAAPLYVEETRHALEAASLPVLALFFAAAGAALELGALALVGVVAVGLVAVRAGTIVLSARWFAPREQPKLRRLWMGLISQAGVTFGLAALIGRTFPTFGPRIQVLILAMVTLHELIGPLLTRRALVASGEASPTLQPTGAH